MVITFVGHRDVKYTPDLERKIINILKMHVNEDKLLFYCGGYGNFDNICAYILNKLKKSYPNIKIIFISPYFSPIYLKNLYKITNLNLYDEIMYPELEKVPYRYAIIKRNEFMIDNADVIISYVENKWGGAFSTIMYAKRKKKKIINIVKNNIFN